MWRARWQAADGRLRLWARLQHSPVAQAPQAGTRLDPHRQLASKPQALHPTPSNSHADHVPLTVALDPVPRAMVAGAAGEPPRPPDAVQQVCVRPRVTQRAHDGALACSQGSVGGVGRCRRQMPDQRQQQQMRRRTEQECFHVHASRWRLASGMPLAGWLNGKRAADKQGDGQRWCGGELSHRCSPLSSVSAVDPRSRASIRKATMPERLLAMQHCRIL